MTGEEPGSFFAVTLMRGFRASIWHQRDESYGVPLNHCGPCPLYLIASSNRAPLSSPSTVNGMVFDCASKKHGTAPQPSALGATRKSILRQFPPSTSRQS